MRGRVKTALLVALAVVMVVALARVRAARVKQLASAPTIQPAAPALQVAEARMGQVTTTIDEQGVLASQTESAVASQVMARCIAVYKREGDSVRAGEIIARLDDQELQDIQAAQTAEVMGGQEAAAAQAAEVARAREDAAGRAADVKAAEAAVAAALSEVDAARQTVAAQLSDVDAARRTAAAALSDVDGAKQSVAALLSDVDGARQAAAAQEAEVERAKENLGAAEVAAAAQKSRTARDKILYENKAISLEQWEASQTAAAQATANVGALKRQIESLSRSVDAAHARVTSLLRGVDVAQQRVVSMQAAADAAKQRVASLSAVAAAGKQRVASLERGVDAARQKVASLQAMEGDARQRILAQQKTAASAAQKVRALASTAAVGRTRIGYTVIRAPYDAVVTARLAEPGNLLAPGQPIYRILKPGSVKVVVNVPQESLALVGIGTPATLSAHGQETRAAVSRVFPALTGGRLGTVEIDLQRAPFGLKSGATLEVALQAQSRRGLVVPVTSLLESDRGQFVYAVSNGAVKCQPVHVEVRGSQEAVVSGGIQPGDQVVVAQSSQLMALHDGQKVQPVTGEGSGHEIR